MCVTTVKKRMVNENTSLAQRFRRKAVHCDQVGASRLLKEELAFNTCKGTHGRGHTDWRRHRCDDCVTVCDDCTIVTFYQTRRSSSVQMKTPRRMVFFVGM